MIEKIFQRLHKPLLEAGIQIGSPSPKYMLYNNVGEGNTAILVFLFREAAWTPFLVVKLSRRNDLVLREFEALREIHAIIPDGTPKPYCFDHVDPYFCLAMEHAEGEKLLDDSLARATRAVCVVERLIDLHCRLHRGLFRDDIDAEAFFRRQIDYLRDVLDEKYFGELSVCFEEAFWRASGMLNLPDIPQHGDFCFSNLLFKGRRVVIIDWETYGQVRFPLYDLCTLFFAYREGKLRLLPEDAVARDLFATSVLKYGSAFNLSKESVLFLIPVFFVHFFSVHHPIKPTRDLEDMGDRLYRELREYFFRQEQWVTGTLR